MSTTQTGLFAALWYVAALVAFVLGAMACSTREAADVQGPQASLSESVYATATKAPAPPVISTQPPVDAAPQAAAPLVTKRVPVSEEEVVRGPADRPQLSLVINVGAGYPPAEEMLDILASRGVKTSFFILGWWAERNPDLLRRIHAEGHEIASHGHSVFDLTSVSNAEVIADLERADAAISAVTGQTTKPLWSPSAGYRDARVRRIAAHLGYRPIFWSADSGDWTLTATPEDVRRRILAAVEPGAIIVLHFDSNRSRTATQAVLGEVIDAVRARGLEPVTITELVGE